MEGAEIFSKMFEKYMKMEDKESRMSVSIKDVDENVFRNLPKP